MVYSPTPPLNILSGPLYREGDLLKISPIRLAFYLVINTGGGEAAGSWRAALARAFKTSRVAWVVSLLSSLA
jgi:hypothetical protein